MEINLTGRFSQVDDYKRVHILIDKETKEKLLNCGLKDYRDTFCVLDKNFIGMRMGSPCLIDEFREGDEVIGHVKIEKYHIRDKSYERQEDGFRFRLQRLTLK